MKLFLILSILGLLVTGYMSYVHFAAGINSYPTWIKANGERREGVFSLKELEKWVGC